MNLEVESLDQIEAPLEWLDVVYIGVPILTVGAVVILT